MAYDQYWDNKKGFIDLNCKCFRTANFKEKYPVIGCNRDFIGNEEWWDAMSEYQSDGEIVVLELLNTSLIKSLKSQFDVSIGDIREIGNVKVRDFDSLAKIVGSKEVAELNRAYSDIKEINWTVILYHRYKFCTIVTSNKLIVYN